MLAFRSRISPAFSLRLTPMMIFSTLTSSIGTCLRGSSIGYNSPPLKIGPRCGNVKNFIDTPRNRPYHQLMLTKKKKRITDGIPVQVWFEPPDFKRIQIVAEKDQRTVPTTIRLLALEALPHREDKEKQEGAA